MRSAISDRARNTPARTWRLAGGLMLVVACSDELTQPSDTNEQVEPPTSMAVAIDSVSPRASEAGERVALRILGTGFEAGTTASVEHGGAPSATVLAEKTDYMNEGELHVTMSIGADATPALYDIIVSNPDGTRAAAGGIFSVQAATPIIVSEAEPSEAAQGETRTIRILGSGFLEGDEVAWERGGVVEEDVVVGQVEFVSSAELSVTIEVREEAPVADYDVTVTRPRKKGIGTEAFTVLPGIGSIVQAQFSFTYDGYRNDSFEVDETFILDPETMDPGSWGVTYYTYEQSDQIIGANHLREDGLVDMMWCDIPGVRVRAPGTHALDCWFIPQYNFETGEFADPEDYTSFHGGDRPGDGTGTVTFTSVTPERLVGTFSIEMHVVDWEDWLSSPSITISDGKFDLPVVSSYWNEVDEEEDVPLPEPSLETGSQAIAINDNGEVVGTAYNGAGEPRAVRWTVTSDGAVDGPHELGTLDGSTHQRVLAINNNGVVVGYGYPGHSHYSSEDQVGFVYDGSSQVLTPLEGAITGWAHSVNDQGVAVGQAWYESTDVRGAAWLNPFDPTERPIQLPVRSDDARTTFGLVINNDGVILGYSSPPPDGEPATVRWHVDPDGYVSDLEPVTLWGVSDMNEAGDIVGFHLITDEVTVVRGSSYIGLSPLEGHVKAWPEAMNSPVAGQPILVVGGSSPDNYDGKPVIWSVDAAGVVTGPTELDPPEGHTFASVRHVNAHGWIVGLAHNGEPLNGVATLWLPQAGGAGYDIITLGTLAEPAGSGSIVFSASTPCRPRPGRPDRSMSCR